MRGSPSAAAGGSIFCMPRARPGGERRPVRYHTLPLSYGSALPNGGDRRPGDVKLEKVEQGVDLRIPKRHFAEDPPDKLRIQDPEVLLPRGDEHPAHVHRAGTD